MTKPILLSLTVLMVFTGVDCRKEPPVIPPPPKDMRNLTWMVDTLAYPGSFQTSMRRIWASSAKDVYVVGHNDQPGPGTMYHFNGKKWSTAGFHAGEGGPISGAISLADIYGFAANNIYAVGEEIYWDPVLQKFYDSSLVIHYDGMQWQKIDIDKGGSLQALGGATSSDFWIGDADIGTLYHVKNGIPVLVNKADSIWYKSFVGNSPNDIYALAYQVDKYQPLDSTRYYMLHYDGSKWTLQDFYIETLSNLPWTFGTISLWIDKNSEVFYSVGYGVYQKINNTWVKRVESSTAFYHITGTSKNNIFVVGDYRQVFHFNGTDWKQLTELIEYPMISWYSAVWTDGEEVFIVGSDGYKSYILHGK